MSEYTGPSVHDETAQASMDRAEERVIQRLKEEDEEAFDRLRHETRPQYDDLGAPIIEQ